MPRSVLASAAVWLSLLTIVGVAVADIGKPPVDLPDLNAQGTDLWVYNDIAKAIEQAKKENKPLFVTFRCIPCGACRGFDAEVASGSDRVAELAREHFVSVRQIEMKGVDLSQFQFDYDLNWAAMFIHPDGTVYARYGTQSAEGPDAYNSIDSLIATMRRVIELHRAYPNNKAELTGKRGEPKPYKTALEMPGLENTDQLRGQTARNNCIHCHNIHDAQQNHAQKTGAYNLDMLYRYPLPQNVGLHIKRDDGRLIERVDADSPAARAGIKAGDTLTHANGQILTSIADLQWVLHHLPNTDTAVKLTVAREGKPIVHELRLERGWKKLDFTWRGSMWSLRPRPGFWAPELKPEELRRLNLPEGSTPLRIQWINTGTIEGRLAQKHGLREGDILIAFDGKPLMRMSPKDFQVHVRLNYRISDVLPLTVLRGGQRIELKVPFDE